MRHRTAPIAALVVLGLLISACSSGTSPSEVSTGGAAVAPTTAATLTPEELISGADVRFSEVHYHAAADREADEFIEIVNAGDQPVQLQGWCITGIKFCFVADTSLEPGQFLVIGQPEYVGSLSNKQDRLRLIDPLEQIREEMTYLDGPPWPDLADGAGHSLQRIELHGDANDPGSWISAEPTPGAPNNTAETALAGEVVFTELNYHPLSGNPAETFVEFVNTTSAGIDMNGWCIEGLEFCWAESTVVAAGEPLVLQGKYDPSRMSRSSDRLRLLDATGTVHDVMRYEDAAQWPAMADGFGHSLHRRDLVLSGLAPGNWVSADPTPGQYSPSSQPALLPMFGDLSFQRIPAAGAEITVDATVTDADQVSLAYKIDFGDEVLIPANLADGHFSAVIPGQPAGALVRFRLIGNGPGGEGTWPRQGDGATYDGTVVASEPAEASALPRFLWFMPDDEYEIARRDTSLHGNEGYPAVFAFEGEVFDNVTIRIKGNQARSNPKKKWKVMLPAGHEWDGAGLIESPVDQFDLLPAATDKSYSREILTADMQLVSGGYAQQVFPMRVERNNVFFGLYMYGESLDGDWRAKEGFSDGTLAYKGERLAKLKDKDLAFSQKLFRTYYERYTLEYIDDNDQMLRDLIKTLNTLQGEALAAFAYQHIDIPQIVEALATMRVVQHSEWQHKNYFVMYDPEDEKWRLIPIDFDLNFGHWFHSPCAARCDDTQVLNWPNYPDDNRLAGVLLKDPVFREMVDRRTRTLADAFFAPGLIEARLAELLSLMGPDAERDRAVWGQVGAQQSMETAQTILLENYVIPQRRRMLERDDILPAAQDGTPPIVATVVSADEAGRVISATLTNPGAVAVDVSGRTFDEIGAIMPVGVVIPPGATISVVFQREPTGVQAVPQLVVYAARTP